MRDTTSTYSLTLTNCADFLSLFLVSSPYLLTYLLTYSFTPPPPPRSTRFLPTPAPTHRRQHPCRRRGAHHCPRSHRPPSRRSPLRRTRRRVRRRLRWRTRLVRPARPPPRRPRAHAGARAPGSLHACPPRLLPLRGLRRAAVSGMGRRSPHVPSAPVQQGRRAAAGGWAACRTGALDGTLLVVVSRTKARRTDAEDEG